jgi:DnaJ homolog subfamily B member 13
MCSICHPTDDQHSHRRSFLGRLIAKEEVTHMIRVKPGWRKGTKVTLEGMGDERPGCLPGDAVFVVSERRHKRFKRLGDDLVLRARVPLVGALTGG